MFHVIATEVSHRRKGGGLSDAVPRLIVRMFKGHRWHGAIRYGPPHRLSCYNTSLHLCQLDCCCQQASPSQALHKTMAKG